MRHARCRRGAQLSGTPGSINRATFKEGVSSLAFEDDTFVNRVFSLRDEDGSGTVDSEEIRQVDCVACAWPLYLCVCVCLVLVLVCSL